MDEEREDVINIIKDLLVNPSEDLIRAIINSTYPNFLSMYNNYTYLEKRAILAAKNEIIFKINEYIMNAFPGLKIEYFGSNTICNIQDEDIFYPMKILNSLKFTKIPNHVLKLKKGVLIMLLWNLNQSSGLCNGTRLVITCLSK